MEKTLDERMADSLTPKLNEQDLLPGNIKPSPMLSRMVESVREETRARAATLSGERTFDADAVARDILDRFTYTDYLTVARENYAIAALRVADDLPNVPSIQDVTRITLHHVLVLVAQECVSRFLRVRPAPQTVDAQRALVGLEARLSDLVERPYAADLVEAIREVKRISPLVGDDDDLRRRARAVEGALRDALAI